MSHGSPAPSGHHVTSLHRKSLPSSSHAASVLLLFLPLWGLHFVKYHTPHVWHVWMSYPTCVYVWQSALWLAVRTGCLLPVYPNVPHDRKPLPTTYTEATILFSHHFRAESCHFVGWCNSQVFIPLCDWLMAFWGTVIPQEFSGSPVTGCQDKPSLSVHTGRMSLQKFSFH